MDSWMLWLDGALEAERATGAAPVFAATYISLSSEPVTPESVVGEGKRGRFGEPGCRAKYHPRRSVGRRC